MYMDMTDPRLPCRCRQRVGNISRRQDGARAGSGRAQILEQASHPPGHGDNAEVSILGQSDRDGLCVEIDVLPDSDAPTRIGAFL